MLIDFKADLFSTTNSFIVSGDKIKKLSPIDKELLLIKALEYIYNTGFTSIDYTSYAIDTETELIRTNNQYRRNGKYTSILGRLVIGHKMANTYFREYAAAHLKTFRNRALLYKALFFLVHKKSRSITLDNITKALIKYNVKQLVKSPILYRELFYQIIKTGDRIVSDITPVPGEKGVICGLCGYNYNPIGVDLPKEFIDRYDIKICKQSRPYDILMLDNKFVPDSISNIKYMSKFAKESVIFIKYYDLQEAKAVLKPYMIVEIITQLDYRIPHDYIFLVRN